MRYPRLRLKRVVLLVVPVLAVTLVWTLPSLVTANSSTTAWCNRLMTTREPLEKFDGWMRSGTWTWQVDERALDGVARESCASLATRQRYYQTQTPVLRISRSATASGSRSVSLRVSVTPPVSSLKVVLQRRVSGQWRPVASRALNRQGACNFRVQASRSRPQRQYRAVLPLPGLPRVFSGSIRA